MRKVLLPCLVQVLLELGHDVLCNPEIFYFKVVAGTLNVNRCPTNRAQFPLLETVDIGKSFTAPAPYDKITC